MEGYGAGRGALVAQVLDAARHMSRTVRDTTSSLLVASTFMGPAFAGETSPLTFLRHTSSGRAPQLAQGLPSGMPRDPAAHSRHTKSRSAHHSYLWISSQLYYRMPT